MTVREVMTAIVTATATIIGGEAQARPRDADYAARAEVRAGAGAGAPAPSLGTGIEGGRPREPLLHPQGSVVGLIHIPRRIVVLGSPGRPPLPLGGVHEVTGLCHHLQGVVHPLLPAVIAAARLVAIAGRAHRQGPLLGHALPQENAVVPLQPVLQCQ